MSEIKEHPILFNREMVSAVLDGRKTQTRRVIKNQPDEDGLSMEGVRFPEPIGFIQSNWVDTDATIYKCPYGYRGDHLWVRETFSIDGEDVYYHADGECCDQISECCCLEVGKPKWKPSIHMPRAASRILLEVVDVRVDRVQSISEEDAQKEGLEQRLDGGDMEYSGDESWHWTAKRAFQDLWDSINSKRGYGCGVNPWVWVIEFKIIDVKGALS